METVAVHCENHMEHTNTLCGQNAEFQHVKARIMDLYLHSLIRVHGVVLKGTTLPSLYLQEDGTLKTTGL
jgi:hypothetical protein